MYFIESSIIFMYTFYFGSIRGMATTFYRGKEDMSSYAVWDNSLSLEKGRPKEGRKKSKRDEVFGTRQSLEEKKGGKKPPPSKRVRDITHISNSEMYWPCGAFVGKEDVHFSWT